MAKPTHRSVKFTREEMDYDLPNELDFGKMRYVGRGQEGLTLARQISRARGAEKRKLIESLPREEPGPHNGGVGVRLDSDVAAVFKDSKTVNRVLRALIENMPDKMQLKKTG